MPYESGLKDLDPKEAAAVIASAPQKQTETAGSCIHVPQRAVHKTIRVRDSLRLMQVCEGCYGVMERAGCIAGVVS